MPNKPESIDASSAIAARLAARTPDKEVPGTLTQWADEQDNAYYEFVGNGEITGTDLLQTVVNREATGSSPTLAPFDQNRDFAKFAAESLLGEGKGGYDADAAIPKGKVEEVSLKDVLRLAAPFLQKYAEAVRAHDGVSLPGGASADDHRKLSGQMPSVGLTLPLD